MLNEAASSVASLARHGVKRSRGLDPLRGQLAKILGAEPPNALRDLSELSPRISYANAAEQITEALERLGRFLRNYPT